MEAEHTKTNYLLKDVKCEVAGNQDFAVKDVVPVPTCLCPAFLDQVCFMSILIICFKRLSLLLT